MSRGWPPLIEALCDPACYDHPVERVEVIETHISWVLLTGTYAYKIKKPLELGFLDFSNLAKRRFYCEEEVRLNRRLAPQLYLEVVAIRGTPSAPRIASGTGEPIEYAVRMRQFPQAARLDRRLAEGALAPRHIDAIAVRLAAFHAGIPAAGPETPFGTPERVYQPMEENFHQIRPRVGHARHAQLDRLERWTADTYARLRPLLAQRKREGFVRECHGDVHLANMALLDGEVVIFDCIEFNENLRWIDVVNELAFLLMDLDDRGRPDYARRALNAYLERTGDYGGLPLLRFYQVYRALVRAKVAAIRLGQPGLDAAQAARLHEEYDGYAALAERYTQPAAAAPAIVITHGFSGSGKTTVTQALLERIDAVRIRSDVERKRLHGLAPEAVSGSGLGSGLYTPEASTRTYERLVALALAVISAGMTVILDAAFLKRAQRDLARRLAAECGAPFAILDFSAPESVLRARLAARAAAGGDASEADAAVLAHQLATAEPLTDEERAQAVVCDTTTLPDPDTVLVALREKLNKGRLTPPI